MSDLEQFEKKVPTNTLTFLVLIAMVFKRKKNKKKAEEPRIGFQGGSWGQGQPPQPGFFPEPTQGDQQQMYGPPAPTMKQPEPAGQTVLTYICPHCQKKFSAQRPVQSLLVVCPKCHDQAVIDPIT